MSRARELAKFGGSGQQVIAGLSSHVGVSTFASNVFMYQDLSVSGNINVTGDLSYDEVSARNQFTSGITTTADLIVTRNANFSGIITAAKGVVGNINATGVSTATFLQATTVNVSAAATIPTLSGTTATFTNLTANGGITGAVNNAGVGTVAYLQATNINATGVSTVAFLQATTVNASGIVTASSFSGSGSGLSNSSVPVPSINITGAGTSTSVAGSDVFVFQSAATGINGKVSASNLSNYILGGSGGASFPSINVTGIGTVTYLQATNVNASGIVTASSFSGSLANTLTLNTSGTGLSGSTTFNNSGAATFTVTSNATSANTSSAIVSRDASGNFSAGTITAVGGLTGNVNATGVSTVAFLQATTVNVSAAATIPTLSGTTATFTNLTANGGITGAVNNAGVGTVAYLQNTNINSSGIHTASSFSGSGSGLSNSSVPVPSINITGAGASTSVVASDVFVFQSAATGINGKVSAQNLSNYILGGSGGATFPAINVTGIATATFLKATTATVGAGLTVSGLITGSAGATITGGETTLSSATVSDLTSGRVVIVGTSGSLDDSTNLTFGNNGLRVGAGGANITGISTFSSDLTVSGNLYVNGTTTQINTTQMTIEDSLIELQVVDGAIPGSDTGKDVGVMMNYFSGSAKKAAMYWKNSSARFVLSDSITESSGVLTAATYGGLEIGSLWLNDCAGQQQVISCSGTTRSLNDITIDGGSF